ncbi:MAG: hypothetical protein ABMA26_06395 [Limisphaerales bacterium]
MKIHFASVNGPLASPASQHSQSMKRLTLSRRQFTGQSTFLLADPK